MPVSDQTREMSDQFIRLGIRAPLSEAGFRGAKRRWSRRQGPLTAVVELRLSTFVPDDAIDFTVEWGLYIPEVAQLIREAADRVTVESSVVQGRISDIAQPVGVPPGLDLWWAIQEGAATWKHTDLPATVESTRRVIGETSVSLSKFQTVGDVLSRALSEPEHERRRWWGFGNEDAVLSILTDLARSR